MNSNIVPVQGWMLDQIVEFDRHHSGFAGDYLRASVERRQVIAAYLSGKQLATEQMASIGAFLAQADHQSILGAAFGNVPTGYRGALGRAGAQPHQRRFYTLLFEMFSNPKHPEITRALGQARNLDTKTLAILRNLPPSICTANVADAVEGIGAATDLAALLSLLVSHGVDEQAFTAALRKVTSNGQLVECVTRWTLKVALPEHPVPESLIYRPVVVAADLRRLALRYQNCLRQYLTKALNGDHAFAEVMPSDGKRGLVVHLRRRESVWRVEGTFGHQNGQTCPALHRAALDHLRAHGVLERDRDRSTRGPWDVLTRLTSWRFNMAVWDE